MKPTWHIIRMKHLIKTGEYIPMNSDRGSF